MYYRCVTYRTLPGKGEAMTELADRLRSEIKAALPAMSIKVISLGDEVFMSIAAYESEEVAAEASDKISRVYQQMGEVIDLTTLNTVQGDLVWEM